MPQCCAYGCYSQQTCGKLFYKVPSGRGNEERRKIWVHRIGRKNWIPNANSRLCEDHFTEDQFEKHRADGRRRLKPNALPSIFVYQRPSKIRKPSKNKVVSMESTNMKIYANHKGNVGNISEMKVTNSSSPKFQENISWMEVTNSSSREVQSIGIQCSVGEVQSVGAQCSVEVQSIGTQCSSLVQESYEEKIKDLERRLNLAHKQKAHAVKTSEILKTNIEKVFNEDQILFLQRRSMRGTKWSDETIQKALKLRMSCGTSGYKLLRDMGEPLPSERTLQEQLKDVKFAQGILTENFSSLSDNVALTNETEEEATSMLDEDEDCGL